MERNKKIVRVISYCGKCDGVLVKDSRDYFSCIGCGMVGSSEEIATKSQIYSNRMINDIYNRYGLPNAKRAVPWWLRDVFKSVGVDLKKCKLV